jgi:hypothetical protein
MKEKDEEVECATCATTVADIQPAELSKRIAFFYTASLLSGAFGGLLAGGIIDGMEGVAGTRGWKW